MTKAEQESIDKATPERIWIANATNDELYKPWFSSDRGQCVEYVRQDIADERVREAWKAAIDVVRLLQRATQGRVESVLHMADGR